MYRFPQRFLSIVVLSTMLSIASDAAADETSAYENRVHAMVTVYFEALDLRESISGLREYLTVNELATRDQMDGLTNAVETLSNDSRKGILGFEDQEFILNQITMLKMDLASVNMKLTFLESDLMGLELEHWVRSDLERSIEIVRHIHEVLVAV